MRRGNGVALGETCIIDHAVATVLTHLSPSEGGTFYSQFGIAANTLHSFASKTDISYSEYA